MSNLFFRKASHLAVKKTDSILENQRPGILRSFTAGILVASALLIISDQKADAATASTTQAESSSITSTSTSESSSSSVSKTTDTSGVSESSASSTESSSADSIRQSSSKETSASESSSMTVASTKDDSAASTTSSQESSKAVTSSVNSSSKASENSSAADNTNSKAATSAEKTSEAVKTTSNETSETTAVSSSSSSSSVSRASAEKSQTKIVAKSVKDATTEIDKVSIGDTTRPTVSAVDVSSYQSGMTLDNFKALKNLGVKTVIVKLTEGTSYTNPNALQQIKNANAAGLNVDIYHYATFNNSTSAKNEATYLNSVLTLNNVAKNILLIADVEDTATKVSGIGTYLNDFWSILNTAGYTNHGVYTNLGYEYLTDIVATVGASRTWIAQYPYHPSSSNLLNTKYGAWQFSANGTLDGYNGALDLTLGYNGFLEDSAGSTSFAVTIQTPSTNATTKTVSTSNEQVKTGQQNIDGKWYLFDANGIMQTGFQYIAAQKKTVYYNASGQMQYGQQHINSKWYLFDQNTGAMKTGFQYIAAQKKTVYYNASGQMQYGQQHINSKWYLFDQNTGAMKTGFQYIAAQKKTVYYNASGQMQYGQQHINSKWYLFDQNTGAMKTGFQYIAAQKKTAYYNASGQMQYGQQHINGKWYLFDQNTGAMKTGFQYIANQNKIVYYDNQGRMLYGSQTINGKTYNLNTATGALTNVDAIGLKLAAASFADKTSQTVVTVASGSKASVYLYSKDKNGIWYRSLSTSGFVGSSGVGKASEGSSTTPIGAYSLGIAFGTHVSVNTSLTYRQIDSKSYWIEDANDSDYNTWQERSWANSKNEHLADYPTQYEYAIVINYNTSQRTKGAGSGFFLHVSNGRATAGCVSVPRSVILQLLSTLKSGAYIVNVNNVNQISNY